MGSHFIVILTITVKRNGIPLNAHFVVPFYIFCIGLLWQNCGRNMLL